MASARRRCTLPIALVLLLGLGCGKPLDLPQEPDTAGNPLGEVAYVRKYLWEGLGRIDDPCADTPGIRTYGVAQGLSSTDLYDVTEDAETRVAADAALRKIGSSR